MKDVATQVARRVEHAPGLWTVACRLPEVAALLAPGQFAMLGVRGRSQPYLRRAFSVADADAASGEIEFLIKVVGPGTACLAGLPEGSPLEVLAPLGNTFTLADLSAADRVAIVAGGVGVAPFPALLRALARAGVAADLYFGGRSAADLSYLSKIGPLVSGRTFLSTDDGTRGERGRVTELLARELRAGAAYRRLFACGPTPMFRALVPVAAKHEVEAELSTEAPMGCGFGVCLGCVLPRPEGGYLISCQEGPILAPSRVDWSRA